MNKERLAFFPRSIFLLKPEYFSLGEFEKEIIFKEIVEALGLNIIMVENVEISINQAREFWGNVSHQSWCESYYQAMSGQTLVFVLIGEDTAKINKHIFRNRYKELIQRLTCEKDQEFLVDIFHGSDPGAAMRELEILGIRL